MKKRSAALILAILMVLASLASCSKEESEIPAGMKIASSEDTDYVMYVPENWIVDKSTLYTSAYSPAYANKGDASNVSVTAYGLGANETTVEKWFESFYETFTATYEEVSEYTTKEVEFGEQKAVQFGFSGKLNSLEYDYIIVATIHGHYIYYLTYTSTPEFAADHLTDIETITANFKFK